MPKLVYKLQTGGLTTKSPPKKWMTNYMDSDIYKSRLKAMGNEPIATEQRQALLNTNIVTTPTEATRLVKEKESNFVTLPGVRSLYGLKDGLLKRNVSNIMIDPNIESQISNAYSKTDKSLAGLKAPLDVIAAHELSHQQRPLNDKENAFITDKSRKDSFKDSHDSLPHEQKADLDAVRYQMFKENIYDTSKRDMTIEDFNKAKNNDNISKSFNFQRLLKSFTPESIIKLNNSIASNNSATNVSYAREGGIVPESNNNNMINIEINDTSYQVKLALTEREREDGLQNVAELAEDTGMLFVFDEPDEVSFWMADTLIDLDIIFINEDEEVLHVAQGVAGSEEPHTCKDVKYVLELNSGSGVEVGDEVDLSELDEEDDENELEDSIIPDGGMEVLDHKGESQMDLEGGERIFSRKHTKVLFRFAKRAYKSKEDRDYKALGRRMFQYLGYQDTKKPDFVEIKEK